MLSCFIPLTCSSLDNTNAAVILTSNHIYMHTQEVATEAILTLGQAFEVAYQLALSSSKQSRDYKGHMRSKSANQLSTTTNGCAPTNLKRDKCHDNVVAANHFRSHSVTEIPSPVVPLTKSASNSPQIQHYQSKSPSPSSAYGLPRAESFSCTSSKNYNNNHHHISSSSGGGNHNKAPINARAPIVSEDEL